MRLTICKLCSDFFPGDIFLCHQDHHMIQEIADFIFDLIGVGIFGSDHNLGRLLAQILEKIVNAIYEEVISIATLEEEEHEIL